MIATAITAILMATLPTDIATLDSVNVHHTDASFHVLAYDADGEITAEIVEWWDGPDIRIEANFPDGVYLSATVRDNDVEIESNDPAAVSERMAAVGDVLAGQDPQAGALGCIGGLAIAAGAVMTSNIPGAFGAGIMIGCQCVPLLTGKEIDAC